MDKQLLRKFYRSKRNRIPDETRAYYDSKIAEWLFSLEVFRKASYVLTYLSYGSEVSTQAIVEESLKMKKRVFVPKILGKRQMEFYEIFSLEECEKNRLGIKEPVVTANTAAFSELLWQDHALCTEKSAFEPNYSQDQLDPDSVLMLVPGLLFDTDGYRLGYGGGFYDTYLEKVPVTETIGLCYPTQIVPRIPREEHDQRLFMLSDIFSEKELNMAGTVADEVRMFYDLYCYEPFCEQEEKDRKLILQSLTTFEDLYLRENLLAHMTASAWVVNQSRTKVLMVFHNIYQSWSWLGGHADGNANLLEVAKKEICEEANISNVHAVEEKIFSVEVLPVEGHEKNGQYVSSHLHLNVTYLLCADEEETVSVCPEENSDVAWFSLEDAVRASTEPWFQERIYPKLNRKLSEYLKEESSYKGEF